MGKSYQINMRTDIIFGIGARRELPEKLKRLGTSSILVVTDSFLAKTEGFGLVRDLICESGAACHVYSDVEADPTTEIVEAGALALRQKGCDLILAYGGGSSIDTAKGIAILATNPGAIRDYFGKDKVKKDTVPVVSIPTTAGTGSEVTMLASIKDENANAKFGINDPHILPAVSIIDPQFLTTLPVKIAAETGMDTLAHLIESYVSMGSNPLTDVLTLEGVRLFGENFLPFVANRKNIQAAEKMGMASMLGGVGISHARTGAAHTLTRPVVLPGVSHGLSTGLVLPYVMEFNIIANPKKFSNVAAALGQRLEGDVMADAQKAVDAVFDIMRSICFPTKLREIGVKEESLSKMAETAHKLDVSALNPRELTAKAIEDIYRKAY